MLQKIQHLLMVDWSDRLQKGVGQIFVGKKRSHVVRREELWANGTFGPTSKTAEDETGHQCVFIDHFQGVGVILF